MKRLLLLLTITLVAVNLDAQQEIQSTQFMLNPFLLNPAYSSVDDNTDLKMGYRYQWVGIEGAPVTYYTSLQTPVGKPTWGRTHPGDFHNWHGTGLVFMKDQLGPYSNTKFNLNYSYNLKITDGTEFGYNHRDGLRLALGTFVGWNSFKVDKDILAMSKTPDGTPISNSESANDIIYQGLDGGNTRSVLDLSFGGILYYREAFYLGVSSSQVLESDINIGADAVFARHYFVSGLAKLPIADEMYLIPSAIFKMVGGAPVSADLNLRFDYRDNLYTGIAFRTGDAFSFMVGTQFQWGENIKNFRVSKNRYIVYVYYSYDYTISQLGRSEYSEHSKGAHELTFGFLLPPRYQERNAEDTWKGFKKGKRGGNRKHFFETVFGKKHH